LGFGSGAVTLKTSDLSQEKEKEKEKDSLSTVQSTEYTCRYEKRIHR
jgi:hypothetical protein